MIPAIVAGFWYLVVALASIQAYQTTESAWDMYTGEEGNPVESIQGGIAGLGLLLALGIGAMLLTRRK